jgi:hypothetical protein
MAELTIPTTVVGLQGRPVATTAPAAGNFLGWNSTGSNWAPITPPYLPLTGGALTGPVTTTFPITQTTASGTFTTAGTITSTATIATTASVTAASYLNPASVNIVTGKAHSSATSAASYSFTAAVMLGLGLTITPAVSGNILLVYSGTAYNNTASAGWFYQLRYGTGAAPAQGAAQSGTAVGGLFSTGGLAVNAIAPFTTQAVVAGLTLGTAYWVDLGVSANTGTATINGSWISAVEI